MELRLGTGHHKALLDEAPWWSSSTCRRRRVRTSPKEFGERVRFAAADVTDEEGVAKAFDLAESLGPVRIVVNCAGNRRCHPCAGQARRVPLNKFARIVNINLVGTFNVLRLGAGGW